MRLSIRLLAAVVALAPPVALGQALPSTPADPRAANDNSLPATSTADADRLIRSPIFTRLTTENFAALSGEDAPMSIGVVSIAPEGAWRAHHRVARAIQGPHPEYGYVGDSVTLDVAGSGVNGPGSADYGRSTTMIKRGYGAGRPVVGEIDGHLIFLRQAGPTPTSHEAASDMDGLAGNIQMQGDPGFAAGLEWLVGRIEPGAPYGVTHEIGLQSGVIDPFGKNEEQGRARYSGVNRLTFGYAALASKGALDRAFYATNSAAGNWAYYLHFGGGASPHLRVIGGEGIDAGGLVFGPDATKWTVMRETGGALAFVDSGGTTRLRLAQDGALTTSAGAVQTVPAAWTTYRPTVMPRVGSLPVATATGRYQQTGKRLDLTISANLGAEVGTASGAVELSLPAGVTAGPAPCVGQARENATTGRALQVFVPANGRAATLVTAENGSPVGANAQLVVSLSCEVR